MAQPRPDNYQAVTGPIFAGRFGNPPSPVAEFIGAPLSGTVPLNTVFTDQSTGQITSWLWTFSDGATSTSQNPSKVWTTAGQYTVSLTVSGPGGSNTRTRTNYVAATLASAPPPPPPPPVGSIVTTLQAVEETGVALQAAYEATVLPLLGAVPAGTTLQSPDDGTLRSAVISTWPDGSAAVVVVAGSIALAANQTRSIRLQAGAPVVEPVLTAARLQALAPTALARIGVGTPVALNTASAPTRIWWATARHWCASWTVPAPDFPGLAVVWVAHVFSDTTAVFIECVIENSLVNMTTPAAFTTASYAAFIEIDGLQIAAVNTANAPETAHSGTRAWYASGWTDQGRTVRVTQAHSDLQRHPLLFKVDQAATWAAGSYAADAYVPWQAGRHRPDSMGAGGDHASIGPLPQWEARALQSGRPEAWKATEANALAILSFNINYRDAGTGLVPTFAAIGSRSQAAGSWPKLLPAGSLGGVLGWETAHCPAAGLMGFISRPSPVFIEIAQKAAVWNGTWSAANNPPGFTWTAGVFGRWYQHRGRGWGIRSLSHAAFLLPRNDPWRDAAAQAMARNADYLTTYFTNQNGGARGALQHIWEITSSSTTPDDVRGDKPGFQIDWTQYYLTPEVCRAAALGLLAGAQQTQLANLADWLAQGAVRWVNEQPNGGWRYVPSRLTIGAGGSDINSQATWQLERGRTDNHPGEPPSVTGTWFSSADNNECPLTYAEYQANLTANAYYPVYFWHVLTSAVERNVTGALQAMQTVLDGVTNLDAWRAAFGSDPRWGSFPRNYQIAAFWQGTNTFTAVRAVRDSLPTEGGWGTLPNTRLYDALPTAAQMDAISPRPVLRGTTWPASYYSVWGSAAWTGHAFFLGACGGHYAYWGNDMACIRIADPPAVMHLYLPAPIAAVSHNGVANGFTQSELVPQSAWASLPTSSVEHAWPAWGPRSVHQYSAMLWDPVTRQVVLGGSNQSSCRNPQAVGQIALAEARVWAYNPLIPDPQQAWSSLIFDPVGTNGIFGFVPNADGTISMRTGGSRKTLNLVAGTLVDTAPGPGPVADVYTPWRTALRDPATNKYYELHRTDRGNPYVNQPYRLSLFEARSIGGLTPIVQLPADMTSQDVDKLPGIVIVNSRAYVWNGQASVLRIDLATGDMQTFSSADALPQPPAGYNGVWGRWAWVPEAQGFVGLASEANNAVVFRPPQAWLV